MQEIRTRPWGYRAKQIIELLARENYCWFGVKADGSLQQVATDLESYDANLVALPAERVDEILRIIEASA